MTPGQEEMLMAMHYCESPEMWNHFVSKYGHRLTEISQTINQSFWCDGIDRSKGKTVSTVGTLERIIIIGAFLYPVLLIGRIVIEKITGK